MITFPPRFVFQNILGEGCFGFISKCKDQEQGIEIAIKSEPFNAMHLRLYYESKIFRVISNAPGFPSQRYFGTFGNFIHLGMDLLGSPLSHYLKTTFSLKSVLMIADQMLSRLEYFHRKGFVHRDIKPQNILIGLGNASNILYLIDFGLSVPYCDLSTGQHIPYSDDNMLVGTARFSSINSQLGIKQTRRDDLESLGYTLLYFANGNLPWMNVEASGDEKIQKICEMKIKTPISALCRKLPKEFDTYLELVRNLTYDSEPDYLFFRKMFRNIFLKLGYVYDKFDFLS